MPVYSTRHSGTNRPGLLDRLERIEREPEYIGARQLKYAENVGKLSRILSTQGPQTVADLALKTGLTQEWVYKALKKEHDLFVQDSPSGGRGTAMRWRWLLSWRHSNDVA